MVKELNLLFNCIVTENNDLLENVIPTIDFEGIADNLLNDNCPAEMTMEEALFKFISVAQYIETDTTFESVLLDDTYDELHEKYINLTGHSITGTNGTTSSRPLAQHSYPELRGSLDKVHFVFDSEIPDKDSRKSLESWLRAAIKKCLMETDEVDITTWFKMDGVSAVFEAEQALLKEILTRKDTDSNTGTVITHLFSGISMEKLFKGLVPESVFECESYGIKTEMLMKMDDFENFKKLFSESKAPKNHRSAVSMITNTLEEDFKPEWRNYLTIIPLQIATTEEINLVDDDNNKWVYVGMENGRYQYIRTDMGIVHKITSATINSIMNNLHDIVFPAYHNMAEKQNLPIDGIVLTILNKDMVKTLGRFDNKNKYQVAYKFAAGVEKSVIENVQFSVGPVTGLITPILEVKPVKIMGNTITNATLSNIDKFDRINPHVGDEIYIKYNIVPTIYKTDDCKESDGPAIKFPTHCPICNEELTVTINKESGNRTVRCTNNDCPSKIAGKIFNYVNKLDINGIGLSTIEDLVAANVLKSIPDLYRLQQYEDVITSLPGYGKTKYDNIIKGINSKLTLYPHELLGSIGIPDVGRRIMQKVTKIINIKTILGMAADIIPQLMGISGIGEKMAIKICEGIMKNSEMINEILNYISLKPYEKESDFKVLFSRVRDKELAGILVEKYGAVIQEDYTKDTSLLIVKDRNATSTKIEKAKKDGKRILTLEEARKEFK